MAKNLPKILTVDDEEKILKSLRRLLKNLEVDVLAASSGPEALALIEKQEISLIISDQRMPGMNGVELLEKAKKISPYTVRILLTGYADIDATIKAINNGSVKYYLNKPWDDDILLSRIKESLELYRITTENKELGLLLKKQNEQLKHLNLNLKAKVDEQTQEIRKQHDDLQQSFMGTIKSFSTIIDLRFKEVGSHSQRVSSFASKLCRVLNVSQKEYQNITIAAYLHDIGKVGLPDKLLSKTSTDYSNHDWEEYHNHTILGQICVYDIKGFEEIGRIIRSHHENFSGGGFPDRIREEEIPFGSRIIRIADAFDKFAFADGYPNLNTLKEAAGHLVENSHSMFDPNLVKKVIEHDLALSFAIPETSESVILKPHELEDGMIITNDIYTKSGMFLLPKGAKLSYNMIKRINKISVLDPIKDGVSVSRAFNKKGDKIATV